MERGGWNDLAKESVNLKSTLRKSKENKSNVDQNGFILRRVLRREGSVDFGCDESKA